MNASVPLVVDFGSGSTKCGYAGENYPEHLFPTMVGRLKNPSIRFGGIDGNSVFVGEEAKKKRGILKLKYPVEHGMTYNWNDMEKIWEYIYDELLESDSKKHPVLISETPLTPINNRKKMCEMCFEKFEIPSYFVSPMSVLTMFYYGKVTGLAIECGDGVSHTCPIFEGCELGHCVQRLNLAGRDITNYMVKILSERGYELTTSKERLVVNDMKEKLGYVCLDVDKDWTECETSGRHEKTYKLPDGQGIWYNETSFTIGSERFRAPEILFSPNYIGSSICGIHEMANNSVQRIGLDKDIRNEVYENIVLGGGSMSFPGMKERFEEDIGRMAFRGAQVKVHTKKNLHCSSWIGGSIVANISVFDEMWVSKKDYLEDGNTRVSVQRKLFHQALDLGRAQPNMLVLRKRSRVDVDLEERALFFVKSDDDVGVELKFSGVRLMYIRKVYLLL